MTSVQVQLPYELEKSPRGRDTDCKQLQRVLAQTDNIYRQLRGCSVLSCISEEPRGARKTPCVTTVRSAGAVFDFKQPMANSSSPSDAYFPV